MTTAASPTAVVLVGIAGYGNVYLTALLRDGCARGTRLVAAVERPGVALEARQRLAEAQVPIFATLKEALASQRADLVVLATPIHRHAPDAIVALGHGAHVLCEKPLAASVAEVREIRAAADRARRWVAVGFQWCFAAATEAVRHRILRGEWGSPRKARALLFWPRPFSYYRRNGWAGRERIATGELVRDHIVSNAAAHYLQFMLFLLVRPPDACARARVVRAELWRANAIETFDSALLELRTDSGCPVFFGASHTAAAARGPEIEIEFDRARLSYDARIGQLAVVTGSARTDFGNPDDTAHEKKLWDCVAAAVAGTRPPCEIDAALPHVEVVEALASQPVRVVGNDEAERVNLPDGDCQLVVATMLERIEREFRAF